MSLRMKRRRIIVGCGVSRRLRGFRLASDGDGDLHFHTRLPSVKSYLCLVQVQYDRDGVCTVSFDPSPPFINAAFSGLSIAILCCYHLD